MTEEKTLSKKEKRALAKEKKKEERTASERKSGLKNLVIGIVVVGFVVWGGFSFIKWVNEPVPEEVSTAANAVVTEGDWSKGNPDASVVVIEYGDFQCPACAQYYPLTKQVAEELGDDVLFVYRQYPLISIHPNALSAARATEAAGLQGKFWEMHDILYEKQEEWSSNGNVTGKFEEYASEIGLDIDQYKNDLESDVVKDAVNNDIASGNQLQVNSTPSFFVNGVYTRLPGSADGIKQVLLEAKPMVKDDSDEESMEETDNMEEESSDGSMEETSN